MRIAIVGTGVSGLVVGHLLHPKHDVTVFEARDRIGGHVNTVRFDDGSREWSVDTGFIVYNEANYPLFTRLLSQLDVPTQPTAMSFSVRCDRTGLEYNGSTMRQLFVQKRNLLSPGYYGMIRDILRFNRNAPAAVRNGSAGMSLGEYLNEGGYSSRLADHYIVPMGSALWSMPRSRVLEMPAEFFVRFFENHGMLTVDDRPEWRVVQGGSERYVEALVGAFRDRIRTSTPVKSVRRDSDRVVVNGEDFDHVVMACHSDQALGMLEDPTTDERQILGALPYQTNDVVLHTDTSVLPRRKRAWGAWNYHIAGKEDAPATVTYDMNILQTLQADQTYCVTLNPPDQLDPARVLYETRFSHPLYTPNAAVAQGRWSEISGLNRTHFCGAYWGFGFHEDGVRSGIAVASMFGAEL
ncbi:MAG: putative NAD/FAD-binding protein [Myxococcota bacterium]|jgi:predicted NAD/FAD-binding protein